VWKNYPITGLHPRAEPAAELAAYVYAQKGNGAFWMVHDAMVADQGLHLELDDLGSYAKNVGVDPVAAKVAVTAGAQKGKIDDDVVLAHALGLTGAPTFFINGREVVGAQPQATFTAIIDEEMAKARALVAKGVPPSKVYEVLTKGTPQ
jgi:protein-disulfide isomerase